MTRIIAGEAGGRRLAVPAGMSTRPTSDRAKEGLFAAVISALGPLTGQRWLDLYAGSGAVGLEALSRGAVHATLVESDGRAAAVIRENIARTGLHGASVTAERAERALSRPPSAGAYDVVFADPPYALPAGALTRVLGLLRAGWMTPDALIVVERATRSGTLSWPPGYVPGRARRYGEATFWYGRAEGTDAKE